MVLVAAGRYRFVASVIVLLLVACSGLVGSAGAATRTTDTARSDLAGYSVVSTIPKHYASVNVTIPEYQCTGTENLAVSLTSHDSKYDDPSGVEVDLGCASNEPAVVAYLLIAGYGPVELPGLVVPGDTVALEVLCRPGQGYTAVLIDVNNVATGAQQFNGGKCSGATFGDLGVQNGAGGYDPLPQFSDIRYLDARVNSRSLSVLHTIGQSYHEGGQSISVGHLVSGADFKTTEG